jgi:hypothetical protein
VAVVAMAIVAARLGRGVLVLFPVTFTLRLRRARRSDEKGGGSDSGQTMKRNSHVDLLKEVRVTVRPMAATANTLHNCIFGAAMLVPP